MCFIQTFLYSFMKINNNYIEIYLVYINLSYNNKKKKNIFLRKIKRLYLFFH